MSDATQAIIFDLDDTLMPEEPSVAKSCIDTCIWAAQRCEVDAEELYQKIRPIAREIWHRSPVREYCVNIGVSSWEGLSADYKGDDPNMTALREWAPQYRETAWKRAFAKCGVNNADFIPELTEYFRESRLKYHELYDDTLESLDTLSKNYPLAMITNGFSDIQRGKINATGIAGYFREILVSGELGFGKPDPRIFRIALSRLGVNPESVWMIGDNLKRDIEAARRIGMKTAWINRDNDINDKGIFLNLEITNLQQFVNAVRIY